MTETTPPRHHSAYWTASLALIVATTLVRYWFVASGQLNLYDDEAQYWDWSRTLQWSYYSKGPLIAVINRLGVAWFGPTELGVRIGAIVGLALMQTAVLAWIGAWMGRVRLAWWTLVMLNTAPLLMAGGLLMTTDNPLLLCWIVAMICLSLAVERDRLAYFIILGVSVALGIMAKYTMLVFIPLALAASLWIGKSHPLGERYWPRLGKALGAGGLAGFLPILLWNAGNGWVGFKHILHRGAMAGEKARTLFRLEKFPEYLGGQIGVITPWWFVFLMIGAWICTRWLLSRQERPNPFDLPRHHVILLTVFFWPVWIFFLLWSLHTKVELNWAATAYPAGFVLAALAVENFMHRQPRPKWRLAWPALGVVVFALLHLQGFIPIDSPKNPVHRLLGWQDLGAKVDQLRLDLGGPETTFVFSDSYGTTAELSFYVPGQIRAFCVAGGRKRNQYDLWPGPGPEFESAVFVVKGEDNQISDRVARLFEKVDPPQVVTTTHQGRAGQTFTLFACRGFQGGWPAQEGTAF